MVRPLYELDDPATLAAARSGFVIAAIGLLSGRDAVDLKVAEVVQAAGGHNAEFYKIFGSRQGLLLAIVEETTRWAAARISKRLNRTRTPADIVWAWCDAVLDLASAPANRRIILPIALDRFRLMHQFPDADDTVVQPLKQVLIDALDHPDPDRIDAAFEMTMGMQARWLASGTHPTRAQRNLVAGFAVEIVLPN